MATIETSVTPPQTPLQASTHGATLTRSRSSPNKPVVSSPWHAAQRTMNSSVQTRSTYLDHEDFSNAIYVGNLEMTINNDALMKIFGRFGTIENVYRPPIHTDKADRTTHFAFIKYTDAESAQRAMQQADNILLGRRRLVVRPRIRSYVNRSINRTPPSSSPQKSTQYPPLSYSHMPPQYYFPYNTHVNQNFMSKILSVFNLPYEMTPKDLFCLFSELGRVEGAFIYNVVDNRGRRVGEVAMGSFYHAKKALESLNNTTLNGYILELAFKPPTLSTPQFIPPINSGHSMMYPPPNSLYPSWQYSPSVYPVPGPVPIPWSYSPVPIDEAMANLSFYGEDSNMMNSRRNSLTSSVASGGGYAHVYDQQKANIDHTISLGVGGLPEASIFYDPMTGLPIPMQTCTGVTEMQDANIPPVTAHQPLSMTVKKTEATSKVTTPVTPVALAVSTVPAVPVPAASVSAASVSAAPVPVAPVLAAPVSTTSVSTASVTSAAFVTSATSATSSISTASTASSASLMPSTSVIPAAPVVSTVPMVSVNTSQNTKTEPIQMTTASNTTTTNSLNLSTSSSLSFNGSSISTSIVPESQPIDPKNLYIKNLDDDIISHPSDIETLFKPYGTIVSSHLAVVPGTGISKGYGFVAFSKAEEAIKAKKSLDGSMVGRKRVFVSWAERRADREKRLKEIFKADNKANIMHNEPEKDVFKTQDPSVSKDDVKTGAVATVEVKSTQKVSENTTGMNLGTVIVSNPMTVLSKWRGTPLSGIVEVEEPTVQVEVTTPTEQTSSESEFKVYSEGAKLSQSMTTELETFEKNEIDKDAEQGQACLRVRDENTSPKKIVNMNVKKKGGWYRKRWGSGWGGNYGNKKEDGDSPVKDNQEGESPIKDILLERIADKENCESKSI